MIYSVIYLVLIATLRARYGVQDLYHHGQRKSSLRFFTTQVCRAYIPWLAPSSMSRLLQY